MKECFVCGMPGEPGIGSAIVCRNHPEGEVHWRLFETSERKLVDNIPWNGGTVPFVDFTQPGALSSPA